MYLGLPSLPLSRKKIVVDWPSSDPSHVGFGCGKRLVRFPRTVTPISTPQDGAFGGHKGKQHGWPDRTGADRPSSRHYQDHRALWLGPIRDLRRLYEQPAAPQPS